MSNKNKCYKVLTTPAFDAAKAAQKEIDDLRYYRLFEVMEWLGVVASGAAIHKRGADMVIEEEISISSIYDDVYRRKEGIISFFELRIVIRNVSGVFKWSTTNNQDCSLVENYEIRMNYSAKIRFFEAVKAILDEIASGVTSDE